MTKPELEPYRLHAVLCCGKTCAGEDRALLNYMKSRLLEMDMIDVRVNRGGCLGVCMQGPIMVVYPGGVWYCNLNEENVNLIIEQHFKSGRVVEELAFHQNEMT